MIYALPIHLIIKLMFHSNRCVPACSHCPPSLGRCIATELCQCHPKYVRNASGHCTVPECHADGCRPNGRCVLGFCECDPGYSWRAESHECLPVCDFCDGEDECTRGTIRCTCWDSYEEQEEVTKGGWWWKCNGLCFISVLLCYKSMCFFEA